MSSACKRVVEKVTARVFTCPGVSGGGNPVTVFLCQSDSFLPIATQVGLAKGCDWESVVAHLSPSKPPRLSFFMPSGEEVSLCAHAAIGAIWAAVASTASSSLCKYETSMNPTQEYEANIDQEENEVGLYMDTEFGEKPVNDIKALSSLLRNQLGVNGEEEKRNSSWPTNCNSSIARPKTLVYLDSLQELHGISPPQDASAFCKACDAIDSTGIYLYAPRNGNGCDYECRQFPRASGYPEDPATGIAAAALAVNLYKRSNPTKANQPSATYNMYQGTAMNRPSLIRVRDIQFDQQESNRVRFKCFGRVEVDERVEIKVDI